MHRVVQLRGSGALLGAERVVIELSKSAPAFGFESIIVAPHDKGTPDPAFVTAARAAGLRAEAFPCDGRFDRSLFRRLREFVRTERVSVLHSHGYKENFYGLLCRPGVPLVATNHLWKQTTLALRFYSWLDARLIRRFDEVVAVSEPIYRELEDAGVPARSLHLIANGVDMTPFLAADSQRAVHARHALGLDPNAVVIGMVSSLSVEKGHRFAVAAVAALVSDFPSLQLAVVGDGPERAAIAREAERLGIVKHVVLCGRQTDVPLVLRAFDVFALPSLIEGLPMALLEAMASRLPVVASRVGDVGTAVSDGQSGYLVPPADVDALTDALRRVVADRLAREQMGAAGRAIVVGRFSSRRMAQRYCELYERALGHSVRSSIG